MFTQRSKLVLAEIIALVQTDDIGRLNFVQLPNSSSKHVIRLRTNIQKLSFGSLSTQCPYHNP